MKTDADAALENLLAAMPVEPSRSFVSRVLAEVSAERRLNAQLREMPIVPAENFVEKTLAAIREQRAPAGNTLAFRRIFSGKILFRAATVAASLALACGIALHSLRWNANLEERLARTLANDPELYALAQAEDETPSFDEFIEASKILASIDPNVLEIFAYND